MSHIQIVADLAQIASDLSESEGDAIQALLDAAAIVSSEAGSPLPPMIGRLVSSREMFDATKGIASGAKH